MRRDRFQIEFNFRDAKQHLGPAACQARTAARHHFHVNTVLAALTWARLNRAMPSTALERFSMANAKLRAFLQLVVASLVQRTGWAALCQNTRPLCRALLAPGQIEPPPN